MKAHWPEFRSCFGICSLRIGVYTIATIGLILHGISIIWNCFMLIYLIRNRNLFTDIDTSTITEQNISEEALQTLIYWSTLGCIYYGVWFLIICIIFVTYAVLFFGIWKRKQYLLKIYMHIYAPYCFFTLVNNCVVVFFVSIAYNALIWASLIINSYLMLIVRSTYRDMSGKRRFLERSTSNDAHNCTMQYESYENPPEYTLPTVPTNRAENLPHCNSCSCIQSLTDNERNLEENRGAITVVLSPTSTETKQLVSSTPKESSEQKELNFKEEHIIYDRNQLQTSPSCVIEERLRNITERPYSSNFGNKINEVNKNIEDVPIIFDQSQLNVGTSPLFENIPVIKSPIKSKSKSPISSSSKESSPGIISNSKSQLNNHTQIIKSQDVLNDSEIKVIKIPRPKTLALRIVEQRTEILLKQDEIPVIYDLHQLNDGSTAVNENSRCEINSNVNSGM